MRSLLAVSFSLNIICLSVVSSIHGQTRMSATDTWPTAASATDFSAAEYAKLLNSPSDRGRQRGLRRLLAHHADHPDVPRLLINSVDAALQSDTITKSTLEMIGLLGQSTDQPETVQALLRWLRNGTEAAKVEDWTFDLMELLASCNSPDVQKALIQLLPHDDLRVAIMATDLLGQQRVPDALDPIQDLVQQPSYRASYAYRFSVLNAICQWKNKEATGLLISQLPRIQGQLKFLVVDHLTRTTGQPFGGNSEHWQQWWNSNRRDYQPLQKEVVTTGDYTWDYPVPTFYNYKVYSTQVVFVIDVSSTMNEYTRAGGTRLQQAKTELQGAVARLPIHSAFNMVAFDQNVQLWQRQSLPAVPLNKELARQTIYALQAGHGTALFDGLDAALKLDRETEAIYLLSDGLPSRGRIRDPAEIVRVITRENRFRKISINTIAVGRDSELLQQLSMRNYGSYRRID